MIVEIRRIKMRCKRCGGMMVYEKFYDYDEGDCFWGWRCINCGEVIDEVIIENRSNMKL